MTKTNIIKLMGITLNSLANMAKDEYISMKNLEKICRAMKPIPSDEFEFVDGKHMKDEITLMSQILHFL